MSFNFDEGDWYKEDICELCSWFSSSQNIQKPEETYIIECTCPAYTNDVYEYNQEKHCKFRLVDKR